MTDDREPLMISVLDAVCANSAMIRNLLVHLLHVGALTAEELETLFVLTKHDLSEGSYKPASLEGAEAYLDLLHDSVGLATMVPDSDATH